MGYCVVVAVGDSGLRLVARGTREVGGGVRRRRLRLSTFPFPFQSEELERGPESVRRAKRYTPLENQENNVYKKKQKPRRKQKWRKVQK